MKDIAKHLAWCMGILQLPLSQIDGFADRDNNQAKLIDVDTDLYEVEEV